MVRTYVPRISCEDVSVDQRTYWLSLDSTYSAMAEPQNITLGMIQGAHGVSKQVILLDSFLCQCRQHAILTSLCD